MNRLLLLFCVAAWLGVALWAATISYFSSLPGQEIAGMVPFELSDKFLHFIAFVGGGVLLVTALRLSTRWQPARIIWIGFAALALYGAADEWHQLSTPNRSGADPLDWLADVLGAAAGVSATALLRIRRPPATA